MYSDLTHFNAIYDDIEREWYVYTSSNYIKGVSAKLAVYLKDDNENIETSSPIAALISIVENDGGVLIIPMPCSKWNVEMSDDAPDDLGFLCQLYEDVTNWRADGYSVFLATRYLVGQYSGASIGALWLATNPIYFAAAFLNRPHIKQINLSPLDIQADIPMPLWINQEDAQDDFLMLRLWFITNEIETSSQHLFYDSYPVEVFFNDKNPVQRIHISHETNIHYTKLYKTIWCDFFDKIRRWRQDSTHGMPAWKKTFQERGLSYYEEVIEGIKRNWYTYIPIKYQQGLIDKISVVLAFHGITSSAEYYIDQSQIDITAEKYGFILVSPQGFQNSWNASEDPNLPDDGLFIRYLLHWLDQHYSIDHSRIFLIGFSLGGSLVNRLLIKYPLLFAGGVAKSGQLYDSNMISNTVNESGKMLYDIQRTDLATSLWQFKGQTERCDEYPGDERVSTSYWLKAAHASIIPTYVQGKNTDFFTRVYCGDIAQYRFTEIRNTGHGYHPQESDIIWADFFFHLRRPDIGVNHLQAEWKENGIFVLWQLNSHEEQPEKILVTSQNGKQFKERILAADINHILIENLNKELEYRIMILPIFKSGLSRCPKIISVLPVSRKKQSGLHRDLPSNWEFK